MIQLTEQDYNNNIQTIKQHITQHNNWPKQGILFYNILPVLYDPSTTKLLIQCLIHKIQQYNNNNIRYNVTHIVGIESRGFIIGSIVAYTLSLPFIVVRKPNKLPPPVYNISYTLEYGNGTLELEKQCKLCNTHNICIIDDLLATGGTMNSTIQLIQHTTANVRLCLTIVELLELNGRNIIHQSHSNHNISIESLMHY